MANERIKSIADMAVFCKKKGFVFQSSEIYNGLSGFWDLGPLGVELFNSIKASWWKNFVHNREDMIGIDASIISHPRTWKASWHLDSFSDISISCLKCKKINKIDKSEIGKARCEFCNGELDRNSAKEIKLLFPVSIGSDGMTAYLRGETAQGMFLNFKAVSETMRMKLPFGIAQIGSCFRNEIAPRDFLFRCREFHIAEFEFFIHPNEKKCLLFDDEHKKTEVRLLDLETQDAGKRELRKVTIGKMVSEGRLDEWHAYWLSEQIKWYLSIGLDPEKIKIRQHVKSELSHYSSATFDVDYEYPFGSKELGGIANRGQYDLTQHAKESGESMEYFDEPTKSKVIPRVIEPTFGMERAFLAVLVNAYEYDEGRGNIVLRIKPELSPIKVAVFPLLSNKEELISLSSKIYRELLKEFNCIYDKSGSIGRRYARQDEIGTPYCITVDFDSLEKNDATIRDRDSTKQARVRIDKLKETIRKLISEEISFEGIP
ncbi:MAG: glycine--tRNA ligase [Candidatus Woesearchaeota archaeon]|nr:glycine--tRNA ligase [Candidatus Woesearchaeota archaeon]